ncbi:MAG: BamA/TamA family outer membrane protein [Chlamydiia bacterium]|nr:BamA/TamA family outer membrane protein [Chlamydiia bacterium]
MHTVSLARLFFCAPVVTFSIAYEVHFVGLDDKAALRALQDASQLVALQNRPPASINGLRYRVNSDLPSLIQTLHAFAYYDAAISTDIQTEKENVQVYLLVQPGTQYNLASYAIFNGDCKQMSEIPCCAPITYEDLGLQLSKPALSTDIVNAELNLLTELARCGYPLAYIDKRRVEVDMKGKTVEAASCVQEGPLAKFGYTSFFGLQGIDPQFIASKIGWQEGDIYNPDLIESTQERLLKSELFSSVYITHGDVLDEQGTLPMKLRVSEAKHRRITLGAFYGTVDGPGFTFTWTHRNVRGMGEIVSLKGDISQRLIAGNISYKKPDFLSFNQNYRAFAELSLENIYAYRGFIYRFANYIDRKIDPKRNASIGLKLEHINVSESASNDTYLLLGLPIFMRYDRADSFLDPTHGYSIVYSATPYQSFFSFNQRFVKQRLTGNFYIPFHPSKRVILALRCQLGSIAGARQHEVPLTKLFLGGSEDDLRGYRYKTVSPLTPHRKHRKPYGGRSAVFTSVEARLKITKTIGVVPFADFGTVTFSEIPDFSAKWYKSVGVGLRYYAFFGPLRVDIGFPLDKRKGVDSSFQIYASVGQTF